VRATISELPQSKRRESITVADAGQAPCVEISPRNLQFHKILLIDHSPQIVILVSGVESVSYRRVRMYPTCLARRLINRGEMLLLGRRNQRRDKRDANARANSRIPREGMKRMRNLKLSNLIRKYSITLAAMFGLFLGVISGPAAASAQEANSSTGVPVHMVVTVKPHRGAQVPAVGAEDVKVYQKGQLDTVASWVPLQGDRAGLQLFILIDDSSRSSLALQYSSIDKFIEEQPSTTAIGVGYIRNGTVYVAQNLTTDHSLAEKSLRLPLGFGAAYTSPYLALSELMKKWPETKDRREILMITSGIDPLGGGFSNDPFTNPYLETAFEQAQRGGFIVYSIYSPGVGRAGRGLFRTNLAQSGLDLLSQKTGGETYYLGYGAPVDITPYLQDVSRNLKNQYGLVFMAKSAKKPTLEPVKVKTEMPNTGLVTAEDGYIGSGM
jgi:hypothetical protein